MGIKEGEGWRLGVGGGEKGVCVCVRERERERERERDLRREWGKVWVIRGRVKE